ncbi:MULTISPECIES: GH12 family glycosyl hydrolase domain-containing protein [Paenibacillus]|uniref:GH12 family glycosyl hydrolase domain-containing protein n=1 Tax=Paenibacillus TaxID=44249 RepID=UPI0009540177|nr:MULTISPECIES: glycosyl hydrolase [Paenibacillus]ASS68682.1 glycosyl hydrolase [Paenibacillus sp. RUD330]SIR55702.1 Glycosyl hydrolase family 12 [Paenibacillus sp. RU4X]SIR64179.1 Glycosyl hydrolase family 12 [Paenibacillus sp. RU4T]
MNRTKRLLSSAVIAALCFLAFASAVYAAAWTSSDKFGNWSNGGYIVYNNVWGSGAGAQTIWANSYSNWGVTSNQPSTGGVKSYPNSTKDIGIAIGSLKSLTSSFNVTVPGSGSSYSSDYDIWTGNYAHEIMLWMNKSGAVGPIAGSWDANGNPVAAYTNVSVGGHTWNVYKGSNGSNDVFSFVRTSNTNSGTVDVLAVLNWIKGKGWIGNEIVNRVQFGFEITSSPNAAFTCNQFSVSYS